MKNFKVYINEILEAILEVEEFTKNLTYEGFLQNKMAIKAVSMNLLLIGENVKLIPLEIRQKYNQIPWARMKSARNFLAHEYPKVEFKDLWDTAKCELPPLKPLLQEILDNE
ncbi:MAG: DUF86 domain-containing protein [Candidatus Bathyarchaeia archaeon]|jgi:uncharacterized protein with HEPN domain